MSDRVCGRCNEQRPHDHYYKGRKICKGCLLEYSRKWRSENRDKYLATQRKSDKKRKHRRHNPAHIWKWRIKNLYGITPEMFHEMYKSQDGKCAACGIPGSEKPGNHKKGRLNIDHNHETGIVRGLLCGNCNRAEGLMKNVEAVKGLLAYMRKHQ